MVFKPDGRRRDFVTRLMFSTVLLKVPESVDPISGEVFPQVIASGLQTSISGLFYEKEWEALNANAITIYNQIGTDHDEEIWSRISREDSLAVLVDTMFVRVMLRFRQFHQQRQTFMRRMTDLLRDKRFIFAGPHFDTLFDTMFGRLRDSLRSELDRARVDIHYGDGTSDNLMRIFDQFDKHKLEQAQPVQMLGGRRAPSDAGATPHAGGDPGGQTALTDDSKRWRIRRPLTQTASDGGMMMPAPLPDTGFLQLKRAVP